MSSIKDLLQALNEMELDEKITSKRAAKKRKLKAKRRAEKKAEQKAQEKTAEQNAEETTENKQSKAEIVVYDPKMAEEQTEFTEAYKMCVKLLQEAWDLFTQDYNKAEEAFKNAEFATPEIYELYMSAIKRFEDNLNNFCSQEYPKYENDLTELEYNTINTALKNATDFVNGLTKRVQLLATKDKADSIEKGEQPLAIEDKSNIANLSAEEKKELADKKKEDSKYRKIAYNEWKESNNEFFEGAKAFGNMIKNHLLNFADFIGEKLKEAWNNIEKLFQIPVARDFLKTIMQANPFTAMLFNGDFGKFGLPKIPERQVKKMEYTKEGLPKNPENLDRKQIKREFFGNQKLIKIINNLYNHEDVTLDEKSNLKKACVNLQNGFKHKLDDQVIKKNWVSLIGQVQKLGDDLNWLTSADKETGTTDSQEKEIDQKMKARKQKSQVEKNVDWDAQMTKEHPDWTLQQKYDALLGKQQESFTEFISKINKTLNEAIQ